MNVLISFPLTISSIVWQICMPSNVRNNVTINDIFMVLSSDVVETNSKIDETREKLSEDLEKMKKKNNVTLLLVARGC